MCKQNIRKLFFSDLIENVGSLMFISEPEDKVKFSTYIVCDTPIITQSDRDFLEKFDVEESEYEYDKEKTKFTFPIGLVIDFSEPNDW